jgi:hypothetical protein
MASAEDAIAELIETNTKLLKKAEEFTSAAAGDGDVRSQSQRKVMECVPYAQDVREGRAAREPELQRFHPALLRHEDTDATGVAVSRRPLYRCSSGRGCSWWSTPTGGGAAAGGPTAQATPRHRELPRGGPIPSRNYQTITNISSRIKFKLYK